MVDLVKEGKICYIGLLEVFVQMLCWVCKVYLIVVVQMEYLLWSCELEVGIFYICCELGVGFVLYSLFGCGFLMGIIIDFGVLVVDDFCCYLLCFQVEIMCKNQLLFECLQQVVICYDVIFVQIVFVWVMSKGEDIVFILGVRKIVYLCDNVGVVNIIFVVEDIFIIEYIFIVDNVIGLCYIQGDFDLIEK